MSERSDNSWVPVAFLGAAGLCTYFVWQFSKAFGLDMPTSFSVIGRFVLFSVLTVTSIYCSSSYSFDMFRLGNTWPILLGVFWFCWWPALDYWAAQEIPSFMADTASVWWDAWYTKWGGLAGIIGIGYLVKKMMDD